MINVPKYNFHDEFMKNIVEELTDCLKKLPQNRKIKYFDNDTILLIIKNYYPKIYPSFSSFTNIEDTLRELITLELDEVDFSEIMTLKNLGKNNSHYDKFIELAQKEDNLITLFNKLFDVNNLDNLDEAIEKLIKKIGEKNIPTFCENLVRNFNIALTSKEDIEDVKIVIEKSHRTIKNLYRHEKYTSLTEKMWLYSSKYSDIFANEVENVSLRVRLSDHNGLLVCPYCNRNYINNRAGQEGSKTSRYTTSDLEHIRPKSKYPLFAMSLNNIIFACKSCNNTKNDSDIFISPFEVEDDHVKFSAGIREFQIKYKNDVIKEQCNLLGIESLYKIHNEEFLDLQKRYDIFYNPSKNQEIIEALGKSNISMEIEQIAFGRIHKEHEYNKYSLSKFKSELARDLIAKGSSK